MEISKFIDEDKTNIPLVELSNSIWEGCHWCLMVMFEEERGSWGSSGYSNR